MLAMDLWRNFLVRDPLLEWPVIFCFEMTILTYVLSFLTGNLSQVDRLWTFIPTIYIAYYALLPIWPKDVSKYIFPCTRAVPDTITGSFSPRALLMLALVVVWMYRLTYNTWRRGLYNFKGEDYRWEIIRSRFSSPLLFQVFNFTFVALAQNILLFFLGIPAKMAIEQPHSPLSLPDYILGALGLLTVLVEFISDNQQHSFQTFKRTGKLNANDWIGARIPWSKRDAERGFITRGLWAWSRHPNFLCEQTFWIIINLFPLVGPDASNLRAAKNLFTPLASVSPCLLLCLLFSFSTRFTESISLSKYPVAYAAYQRRVGMFSPLITWLKGVVLALQGKKAQTDEAVFGHSMRKIE